MSDRSGHSQTDRGRWAEELAVEHLRQAGARPLDRNYRCPRGEIDLVVQDDSVLAFVEVRYRRSSAYGSAAESVDAGKRQRLILTAQHYLQAHSRLTHIACRFDVVLVTGTPERAAVEWIRDAFQA